VVSGGALVSRVHNGPRSVLHSSSRRRLRFISYLEYAGRPADAVATATRDRKATCRRLTTYKQPRRPVSSFR
jgi:hypothetical protein